MTTRGASPCPPYRAWLRSDCSVFGRWPGALGVDDHGRNLGHARQAHELRHEREAGPGGRGHRLLARERCAEDGGQRRDLVLRLDRSAAEARKPRGEPLEDVRRGRDRIPGVILETGVKRAQADRLIAGEQHPLVVLSLRRPEVMGARGKRGPGVLGTREQ
jgi:hypothetical protein